MARFGLPGISSKLPSDLKQFLDRVREWMTTRGENLVTRDELVNAGLITSDRTGAILPADPGAFSAIPPPAPENVVPSGAMTSILVEWNAPRYGNHAYAEVWASGVDDLGAAAMVGTSAGTMFTHAVGAGETRYYWVRFVSRADVIGPYNAVAGTLGRTSSDPTWLMGVLSDETNSAVPFVHFDMPTVVNGVSVPAGTYIKSAYIADASITTAQIGTATIDAARITGKLTASQIGAGSMEVNEYMQSAGYAAGTQGWRITGDGNIYVRSDNYDSGVNTYDYLHLNSGKVNLHRYIPALGQQVLYAYLSRVESGLANNNDTVVIPGYWKSQPRVMVSPASLGLYKTAYANQDQSVQCQALSLQEVVAGQGRWQFNAVATLNLAANTGTTAVNVGSGDISTNSWTSATYTTPANCTSITPSVSLKSQRGNGLSQWYYRSVRWRVEYWSGSAWVELSWRTVNMGAQFNAITDSGAFTFPSAAVWQWRIYAEWYDTDSTVFGSASYEYAQDVVGMTAGGSAVWTGAQEWTAGAPASGVVAFNNYSLPSGWTIYKKVYTWTMAYRAWLPNSTSWISSPSFLIDGQRRDPQWTLGTTAYPYSTYVSDPYDWTATETKSKTITGSNLSASLADLTYSVSTGDKTASTTFTGMVNNGQVTVYRQKPVANTTTPVNNSLINSYNFNLASAQVLATGTLNWLAVGD